MSSQVLDASNIQYVASERMPQRYIDWPKDLRHRINTSQQAATLAVNNKLVLLYWQIARDILTRQAEQSWGAKVIKRLVNDLHTAFPLMKGKLDNAIIGLLLCINKIVAEYAFGDKSQPMGIAEFNLLESLTTNLEIQLPRIKGLERELQSHDGDHR